MRSSSDLFPVSLISAEILGDLTEDVYLLNPERSDDPSVRIAVTRVSLKDRDAGGPAVILQHGLFHNRHFWITAEAEGLAAVLAREGFDVWIPELRGHGHSPVNRNYHQNRTMDFIRDDVPAVNDFVVEQSGQRPFWIGQGWGGLIVAAALGLETMPSGNVSGVALIEPRLFFPSGFSRIPGLNALKQWRLKRQGAVEGGSDEGPEHEPYAVIRERMRWRRRGGVWSPRSRQSAWNGIRGIDIPLTVFMSEAASRQSQKDGKVLFDRWGGPNKTWYTVETPAIRGAESSPFVLHQVQQHTLWPLLHKWLQKTGRNASTEVHRASGERMEGK